MSDEFAITPVRSAEDLRATATLFERYAASLPIDLGYQNFAAELAGLPGPYAPPDGELLLARGKDGAPLGCVALRPMSPDGCCEMKRLFLLPAARGLGVGRALASAIIEDARRLGYREIRLDTLPSMQVAIGLYLQLGFETTAAYYSPAPAGTVFMRMEL